MIKRSILVIFALAAIGSPVVAADGWRQLWNHKDLSGWQFVGDGQFVVENGSLKAIGAKGKLGLLVYTREQLGNCILRVVYKGERGNSNSGVYIRIPEQPTEPLMPVRRAHEVQVAGANTGEIFARTRVQVSPSPVKPGGEWNTLEITMDGPRTTVMLNGVKVTDYKEGDAVPKPESIRLPDGVLISITRELRPEKGYMGLQCHDADILWFSEVAVKPLKK